VTILPTVTAVPPTLPAPPTTAPATVPSPTPTANPSAISPENAGQLTQLAQLGNGRIDSITWSPDGTTFAIGSSQGIDFYNAQTLQKTQTIQTEDNSGLGTNHVRFSPLGDMLIVTMGGYEVDRVTVWDVSMGQYLRDVHDASLTNFTTDGQLAYVDWVSQQMIWQDPISGENLRVIDLSYLPRAINLTSETAAELYQDNTVPAKREF